MLCLGVRKSDSQYEETGSPNVGLPISEKLGVRMSYDFVNKFVSND